jgi:hypothetical protein
LSSTRDTYPLPHAWAWRAGHYFLHPCPKQCGCASTALVVVLLLWLYAAMHATMLLSAWRTAAFVLKAQQTRCTVAKLSLWACVLLALRFWHGVVHSTVLYCPTVRQHCRCWECLDIHFHSWVVTGLGLSFWFMGRCIAVCIATLLALHVMMNRCC